MGNNSRLREMAAAFIGGDVPGVADVHICGDATATQTPYQYWGKWARGQKEYFHTTITAAINACVGGRNDVVLISPDSHTQGASLAWNENNTHLVGMCPSSMMNMRARIGHNANFDNLINITGYGCLLKNLYFMYGRGNAANLTCCQITGNRNTFKHVHFGGPFHTTEADQATFKMIDIAETSGGDGLEHYFDHCVVGSETTAWTNGDMIKISGTPRLIFEDCIFLMRADNAQVTFLDGTAGDGQGFILFKNTTGIQLGTANTVALGATGWAANTDIILHNSGFTNVTDVIGAADEAKLIAIAIVGATANDQEIGMGIPYDQS